MYNLLLRCSDNTFCYGYSERGRLRHLSQPHECKYLEGFVNHDNYHPDQPLQLLGSSIPKYSIVSQGKEPSRRESKRFDNHTSFERIWDRNNDCLIERQYD